MSVAVCSTRPCLPLRLGRAPPSGHLAGLFCSIFCFSWAPPSPHPCPLPARLQRFTTASRSKTGLATKSEHRNDSKSSCSLTTVQDCVRTHVYTSVLCTVRQWPLFLSFSLSLRPPHAHTPCVACRLAGAAEVVALPSTPSTRDGVPEGAGPHHGPRAMDGVAIGGRGSSGGSRSGDGSGGSGGGGGNNDGGSGGAGDRAAALPRVCGGGGVCERC